MLNSTKHLTLLLTFVLTNIFFTQRAGNSIIAGENSIFSIEKFELVQNLIVVKVKLAGNQTQDFILDSGCESVILDENLKTTENNEAIPIKVKGAFGESIGFLTSLDFLEFANVKFANVPIVRTDLSNLKKVVPNVAGILGKPVFNQLAIEIDYKENFLTLHDSSKLLKNLSNTKISKISFKSLSNPSAIPVFEGNNDFGATDFIFDTGFQGNLLVINKTNTEILEETIKCSGLNAEILASEKDFANVSIDEFDFAEVSGIFSKQIQTVNNKNVSVIGNQLLKNYKVFFDFPNSSIWLDESVKN
ncbi:retropepsin-like domain-containing protein [bacterium]|nr:retropepsin-like domain-containing protein [bacterium]